MQTKVPLMLTKGKGEDEEDYCGEDSSSTLMDPLPTKGKWKAIETLPERKKGVFRI